MFIGHKWEPATATIVSTREVRQGSDGRASAYEFVADVQPANAEAFRSVIKEPMNASGYFLNPPVGHTVKVFWAPRDNHVKFDTSDPQLSFKPDRKKQKALEDADLAAAPGSPPASA
jgi:hypothetical protein